MEYYQNEHLPLVTKIPGLVRSEVTHLDHALLGEGYFLMAELYFSDSDSLKAGMKSSENKAAAADLTNFAEGLATIMTGVTL